MSLKGQPVKTGYELRGQTLFSKEALLCVMLWKHPFTIKSDPNAISKYFLIRSRDISCPQKMEYNQLNN